MLGLTYLEIEDTNWNDSFADVLVSAYFMNKSQMEDMKDGRHSRSRDGKGLCWEAGA